MSKLALTHSERAQPPRNVIRVIITGSNLEWQANERVFGEAGGGGGEGAEESKSSHFLSPHLGS